MTPNDKGLWLLPTYNRAKVKLPRFLKAAKATGMVTPGAIIVDQRDWDANQADYEALELPKNWRIHVVEGGCLAKATEQARIDLCDGLDWVGWLSDDLVPETANWDQLTIAQLNGWNCVSTNDGKYAPQKFNGATVWSGDLLRAVGYFFPEGMGHFYIDNVIEEIGKQTGCWTCDLSIMVRHVHASWAGAIDATYHHTNTFWEEDDRVFHRWLEGGEMLAAADRVLALMESKGVNMIRPNFKGLTIMIATPCASGRYERGYVNSLMQLQAYLKQFGAETRWAELPMCSDISLARNKLFGSFLRGEDDYCLWLDDDMSWTAQDFGRMLTAAIEHNKDFVAVAGPRKVTPPSFAVNVSDDFGNAVPLKLDPETQFIEATGIGFAFALVSRAWAVRMAQGYPELRFKGADGREEFAVFNPLVVNEQYYSEDFAACYRWRQLGGKILVDSEVALGHSGSFTWYGSWLKHLADKIAAEEAERKAA